MEVLQDELALKRLHEDGLSQTFHAGQIRDDDGCHFLHHRQPALNFSHDAALPGRVHKYNPSRCCM